MTEGIKYADHLNTAIKDTISRLPNGIDVFQYKRPGVLNREVMFLSDGTYVAVGKTGEVNIQPYLGAPFVEPTDIAITPFTIRSLISRPFAWAHRKLEPESYSFIYPDDFGEELDSHGGIDFIQVVSPTRAAQIDYIRCADGQRYILDKVNSKVFRF